MPPPPPSPFPPPSPLTPGAALGLGPPTFTATYLADFESPPGVAFDLVSLDSVVRQVRDSLEGGYALELESYRIEVLPSPPRPPPPPPTPPPPPPAVPPPADHGSGEEGVLTDDSDGGAPAASANATMPSVRRMAATQQYYDSCLPPDERIIDGATNGTALHLHTYTRIAVFFRTTDASVQRNIAEALDPTAHQTATALTGNVHVTNAAGRTLARCTAPWLGELGRKTIAAPSPPPPSPPAPPATPPRVFGGGALQLDDFVNVSNVASAALGVLMTKAQGTIGTAATAAATAAIAASAGGAAAGGAAGGRGPAGAVGAVQGAQRLGNIGRIGGPPPDGDLGDGGGWTGGRLGFGRSGGDGRRRRLQSRGGSGGSGGSGTSGTSGRGSTDSSANTADPLSDALMDALYDITLTLFLFFAIAIVLHFSLLLCWLFCANRGYYRWQAAHGHAAESRHAATPRAEGGGLRPAHADGAEGTPCRAESVVRAEGSAEGKAAPSTNSAERAPHTLGGAYTPPPDGLIATCHALRVQRSFRARLARASLQARRAEADEAAALARASAIVQKMLRGRRSRMAFRELVWQRITEQAAIRVQRWWRVRQWRRTTIASVNIATLSYRASPVKSTPPPSPPSSPPPSPSRGWQCSWRRRSSRVMPSSPGAPSAPRPRAPPGPRLARVPRCPPFRPLPAILVFPTLEKFLVFSFAPGMAFASTAVVGAQASGAHEMEAWSLWVASIAALGIGWFLLTEFVTLRRFRKEHEASSWQGAEKPQESAEVDDPILALMGRMRLMRPRLRSRGGFEAPEEDSSEPARTERALRRAFLWTPRWPWRWCCGKDGERAGDVLDTLPMWMDDSGQGAGVYYIFVQFTLQLIVAMQVGLLYANPWNGTSVGGLFNLSSTIAWQVALVLWVASHKANDLFTALENLSSYVAELSGTCLVLASNLIAARADGDLELLATSLELATVGSNIFVYSAFLPIAFTVYDTFIVPVVLFCWKSDVSYPETCCQLVLTLIQLPIVVASGFLGIHAGANATAAFDLLGNTENTLVTSSSQVVPGSGGGEGAEGKEAAVVVVPRPAAPPSKAARKRIKREEFLAGVRAKLQRAALAKGEGAASSRAPDGRGKGRLVEREVTATKASGAAAGMLLRRRKGKFGEEICVVQVSPDGPCANVVVAGDVLLGVNHLGNGTPLEGSDIEAAVDELRRASALRLRVLCRAGVERFSVHFLPAAQNPHTPPHPPLSSGGTHTRVASPNVTRK